MANIIIKSDERKAQGAKILRDFGYDPRSASKEIREYADATAQRSREAIKEMEGKRK